MRNTDYEESDEADNGYGGQSKGAISLGALKYYKS
jgi:hypothetical protein